MLIQYVTCVILISACVVWAEEAINPEVRPPVMEVKEAAKRGRITINIHDDGSLKGLNGEILDSEQAVKDYIKRAKDAFEAEGREPSLFLRGTAQAVFNQSKEVIRVGSRLGVTHVIFATYRIAVDREENEDAGLLDEVPRFELPGIKPDGKEKQPLRKLILQIDNLGRILWHAEEIVVLDQDERVRATPLLNALLEKARKESGEFTVTIRTQKETRQERVIDVLKACSSVGISTATFEMDEE